MPHAFLYAVRTPDLAQQLQGLDAFCASTLEQAGFQRSGRHGHYIDNADAVGTQFILRPSAKILNRRTERGDAVIIARAGLAFADSRDMAAMLRTWDARGVHLWFLDLPIDTAVILQILTKAGEMDKASRRRRTKTAHERLRSQGQPVNQHRPLTEGDFRLVDEIRRLREAGWPWRRIRQSMILHGVTNSAGRIWDRTTIRRLASVVAPGEPTTKKVS